MKYPEYFPLLEFESQPNELPFRIMKFRWAEVAIKLHNEAPHMQDYNELIWITKGSGIVTVDLKDSVMGVNSVCCITSGQLHQLKGNDQMEGYVFLFKETFVC